MEPLHVKEGLTGLISTRATTEGVEEATLSVLVTVHPMMGMVPLLVMGHLQVEVGVLVMGHLRAEVEAVVTVVVGDSLYTSTKQPRHLVSLEVEMGVLLPWLQGLAWPYWPPLHCLASSPPSSQQQQLSAAADDGET